MITKSQTQETRAVGTERGFSGLGNSYPWYSLGRDLRVTDCVVTLYLLRVVLKLLTTYLPTCPHSNYVPVYLTVHLHVR